MDKYLDKYAVRLAHYGPLVARILLAQVFIVSGFGKLKAFAATAAFIGNLGLPAAQSLLVLTIALMPLGAVALLVSLQSARTADKQRRVDVEIAATEAARKLSAELTSDIVALSQAANGLDLDPQGVGPCARLNAQLA